MNRKQAGFSLIELLIAMTCTLIISGAIFGLMAGGQSRFRMEPAITDRQQNIRIAMDMIQRDIAKAGMKMEALDQVFRVGLNGASQNAAYDSLAPIGPGGAAGTGNAGQRYRSNGHFDDAAGNADYIDYLEIWGNDGDCPDVPSQNNANGANFLSEVGYTVPSCYSDDSMVLVTFRDGTTKWGFAHNIHANNTMINFPPGLNNGTGSEILNPADLTNPTFPQTLSPLKVIRYEVHYANDPRGGLVPNLYRSISGGRDPIGDGQYHKFDEAGNPGQWEMVASGIEDLQVSYQMADGTMANEPADITAAVGAAKYNAIVRQVRVTLTARAVGQNIQGQTQAVNVLPGNSRNSRRGQLTSVTTPRAALVALAGTNAPAAVKWQ